MAEVHAIQTTNQRISDTHVDFKWISDVYICRFCIYQTKICAKVYDHDWTFAQQGEDNKDTPIRGTGTADSNSNCVSKHIVHILLSDV